MQQIETSRFGVVKIQADQIISFPRGLIGFSDVMQFAPFRAR